MASKCTLKSIIAYFFVVLLLLLTLCVILFESLYDANSAESIAITEVRLLPNDEKPDSNLLLLQRPKKQLSTDSYSTYICIGDNYHKPDTDRKITCKFTNICYNTSNAHFQYFQHPQDAQRTATEIIYDNLSELKHDFWDHFLLFRHNPPTFWRPHIQQTSAPSKHDNKAKVKWFMDGPTVYHYPFVMDNFGHCLGDNFYTIWQTLDLFESYSWNDMQLLLHFDKTLQFNQTLGNILKIYPYVSRKMPLVLSDINKRNIIRKLAGDDGEFDQFDAFCFSEFYVGTTSLRLQRSMTKPLQWNKFIYHRFLNHAKHYQLYNQGMSSPKQKILFLNKTAGSHRRRYVNDLQEVATYVSDLFGVEFDIYCDTQVSKMSLEEQINLMLQYSILVTPCGSLAFLGVFMREGTVMITMDWFNELFNMSTHLESYLWEFETRRKILYYYVTAEDVVRRIDEETIKRKRISLHDVARDWSDYILRPKRLATYVYSALLWVENYNGWSDTFQTPLETWLDS